MEKKLRKITPRVNVIIFSLLLFSFTFIVVFLSFLPVSYEPFPLRDLHVKAAQQHTRREELAPTNAHTKAKQRREVENSTGKASISFYAIIVVMEWPCDQHDGDL